VAEAEEDVLVVVEAEIAGNRPIKTWSALERGIWEQIPRFFLGRFSYGLEHTGQDFQAEVLLIA
jgi:hypothetical protein